MQTIVGSGGVIGIELAKALKNHTDQIRLVARNPKKINENDLLFKADVLNFKSLNQAIAGSKVVYATVGFPYSVKIWQQSWPLFIENLIRACETHGSKLVFFDNVYMYDVKCLDHMTEQSTINPSSKKGQVRAKVANMILESASKGRIEALIARSADFYGPSIAGNSVLTEMVFKPLSLKKKAMWLASENFKHSFTYTPDAGKATALLGNSAEAYNQVWHLPTASNPPNGKEWIESIAEKLQAKASFRVLKPAMLKFLGLFMPIMKETVEMLYQYDRPYIFKSEKFESAFNFNATPYSKGIEQIISTDYV